MTEILNAAEKAANLLASGNVSAIIFLLVIIILGISLSSIYIFRGLVSWIKEREALYKEREDGFVEKLETKEKALIEINREVIEAIKDSTSNNQSLIASIVRLETMLERLFDRLFFAGVSRRNHDASNNPKE